MPFGLLLDRARTRMRRSRGVAGDDLYDAPPEGAGVVVADNMDEAETFWGKAADAAVAGRMFMPAARFALAKLRLVRKRFAFAHATRISSCAAVRSCRTCFSRAGSTQNGYERVDVT